MTRPLWPLARRMTPGFMKRGRDAFLRASWVFAYGAIVALFRLLQKLERLSSNRGAQQKQS